MIRLRLLSSAVVLSSAIVTGVRAHAQAVPTAAQSFRFSVFGMANGTYTNLDGGRNAGITAGVDLDLPAFHGFLPSIEGRGTYPVDGGAIDSQRNLLAGLRVAHTFGPRLLPYGDVLFGRSRIDYAAPGYQKAGTPVYYTITSSNALAAGGGLEFRLTESFSAKADAQIIHQQTPVTDSGSLNSTSLNLGLAWRPHFHRRKGVSETDF